MMKYIFVLVLLQVCHSVSRNVTPTSSTPNPNLNTEIINNLKELNMNVSHTMPIPIPGKYMLRHPSKCVDAFIQKLRRFLRNMTQEATVNATIKKLVSNLEQLAKHPQKNSNCTMTMETPSKTNPFKKHIDFIRKLNTRR